MKYKNNLEYDSLIKIIIKVYDIMAVWHNYKVDGYLTFKYIFLTSLQILCYINFHLIVDNIHHR